MSEPTVQSKSNESMSNELKRPGILVTSVNIPLHTKSAILLYAGRLKSKKKSGIQGLESFTKICSMVNGSKSARELIEERLKFAGERLEYLQRQNDVSRKKNRLSVEQHASRIPMVIDFETTTSLVSRGAQLLLAYDMIARDILFFYRLGIYDAAEFSERTRLSTKYIRSAFASGFDALDKVRKKGNDFEAEKTEEEFE